MVTKKFLGKNENQSFQLLVLNFGYAYLYTKSNNVMESHHSCNYLLFTTNYPLARLEISLFGGLIMEKISDQAFIVSFQSDETVNLLNHSTQEVPYKNIHG